MFVLPELPYPAEALELVLSAVLMRTHHDKHHATYVNNINAMIDSGRKATRLEDLVRQAEGAGETKLFNNAAQAWNHAFFWNCMAPARSTPSGDLAAAIEQAFGGLEGLKAKFVEEGATHFASGWVWLVADGTELSVISTHDAATPITRPGVTPILVCDVWEHAYYLDYKQDRKAFLERWFDSLANWRFAAAQYDAARGQGEPYRYPEPVAQTV